MKPRITIVGAGPVGILTAIGLNKLGFDVQLVERMSRNELMKRADRTKLSRLYAISLGSYQIMKDVLGIDFDTKDFQPINRIFINDGKAHTTFEPQEINEKIFGYMVEESDLFAQLIESLDNSSSNLQVIYGASSTKILDNPTQQNLREGALSLRYPDPSQAGAQNTQRLTCAPNTAEPSGARRAPEGHPSPSARKGSPSLRGGLPGKGAWPLPGSSPSPLRGPEAPPGPSPASGPSPCGAGVPRGRGPSTSDRVSLLIESRSEILESDLIFATDGRNSIFRKQLPFGENKKDYNELALVFKIRHPNFNHQGLAVETFFPSGPFAVLPHKEWDSSSIVLSSNKDKVTAFLKLNNNMQHSLIAEKLPDFYGNFEFDSEFITYPLHLNTLDSLHYKNVLLLGDSSHVVHPVAGQGFNLGIRDVRDILQIIKDYNLYTDIEHMLDEYQKLRKRDISKLANSTDFLSDLFSNNNILLKCARRIGLNVFDSLPKHIRGMRSNTISYAAGK